MATVRPKDEYHLFAVFVSQKLQVLSDHFLIYGKTEVVIC